MALPAIAALIARLTAQRVGMTAIAEAVSARGGLSAILGRAGAGAAAAETEAAAAAQSQAAAAQVTQQTGRRWASFKTAEEMLKRPRPQAPHGGVDIGGVFYKAGRFIPRAAVESALGQSAGGIPARPIDSLWSRPGPPPIQAPPVQTGGAPGSSPSAGQDSSEAVEKLTTGVSKLLLVMSPAAALGVVLAKTPSQIERFGRSLLDAQVPLRRFSGTINASLARLERNDLLRQRDRAEATSGSTATLAKAIDQLGNDTKEIRQAAVTFFNLIATIAVYAGRVVAILNKFNPVMDFLMKVLRLIEKFLESLLPKGGTWHAHINDLARGRYTGKHNQPKGKP